MEPCLDSELPLPPSSSSEEFDAAAVETRASDVKPLPSPTPAAEGRQFHHYQVYLREDGTSLHELGRGAMGVSYKARDVNLDVPVAIKVINAALPGHYQARERFRREARAAAQLRHPNVASVFHFGETPAGECFYAMEFIEGETLAARVQRDGPLPVAQVLEIALQVTAALIAADERGLVHRDLKPANIMLVSNPRGRQPIKSGFTGSAAGAAPVVVKVIDFGLAKAMSGTGPDASLEVSLTREGNFLGTPAYASPEQAEGGKVDARSDIYSLGVTLWYLLTGKLPFAGGSFSEVYNHQLSRPPLVGQLKAARVPAPVVKLLRGMLAADPARRPASPGILFEMLEQCCDVIGCVPLRPPPPPTSTAPLPAARRSRPMLAVTFGLVALALGGTGAGVYYLSHPADPAPTIAGTGAVSTAREKSIAVLPLEDLSGDLANPYFADGIQDDLLSSLAKIKDLKVISRSSVMSYRNAARNLREIGQQLGVTTVLEGSVRRSADRVLVNVSLSDTASGRQLWGEHFDRTLADALTLQGELATEIAASLRATLSPEEKARVETKPTNNPDAYVLYLRAREYHTRPTGLLQDYQTAVRLYGQALELDPLFALAHARLSAALGYMYLNFLPTAETHDRARAEAEEALRLQPDLGEGHLARGLCLYWTEKKYPAALQELEEAARLLPGNAEIDLFSGAIRRRQGRWSEALVNMRRSLARDPRAVLTAREIMLTDYVLRDWPAAARDGDRAVALTPELPLLAVERAYAEMWAKRDLTPLLHALASARAGEDPDGEVTFARWDANLLGRDFGEAERAVTNSGAESVETPFGAVLPKSYLLGCIALARGDAAHAKPLLEAACGPMETEARNVPLDAFRQAHLGVLYALLGRKEDALRQGRLAVTLLPETRDAYYGPSVSGLLALICARVGENDEALALIGRLLKLPGPLSPVFDASITQSDLVMRWQWDPLRADPRFKALLAGPEPKTVYQ